MNAWGFSGGAVEALLVLLFAASVAIFFARLVALRRAQTDYADFIRGVANILAKGHAEEALVVCDETSAPVARIVAAAIQHRDGTARAQREAVDAVGRTETGRLERRLAVLAIIAQVAPSIGLFGVLIGFIDTVLALNAPSIVVSRVALFAGLMDALVPAATGLLVSVAAQVMYGVLRVKLDRLVPDFEAAASGILAVLADRRGNAA